MQWVEITAPTVAEATQRALEHLGIDESDAEIEIVSEPTKGLFGKLRGEARVRARVRPTHPRPKVDRRERKRAGRAAEQGGGSAATAMVTTGAGVGATVEVAGTSTMTERTGGVGSAPTPAKARRSGPRRSRAQEQDMSAVETGGPNGETEPGADPAALHAQVEAATSFLRGLLASAGVHGEVTASVEDGDIEVRVEGDDLGLLIGPRGQTLLAVQDLTRTVASRPVGGRGARLRVDIAGYWRKRHEALTRFAVKVAGEVAASGTARALEPMSAADRKVVHDAVNQIAGVETRSEGEEPFRRVVIAPR